MTLRDRLRPAALRRVASTARPFVIPVTRGRILVFAAAGALAIRLDSGAGGVAAGLEEIAVVLP